MEHFEKLGAFYLGREYDLGEQRLRDDLLLYDSKDLTTNAVCVGMTGSGKTGLCLSLLEEAAIDGIPTLAIDPKGDLGNLLLTFPELRPKDFRPWVDAGEAARKGATPDEHAAKTAALWKKGLGEWGQDGSRIARFREAVDLAIYTPGSNAGLPLSIMKSFSAPPPELVEDSDAFREKISSTVSGMLALLGIQADPLRSREHILISSLVSHAWQEGRDLDLPSLIRGIQTPPFKQVGVMDLDSFYPPKERFELSLSLNNLLASPGFASWMEGERLDIPRLLWTPEGKPRISILSIAHLSEDERMFLVTLVLNEVLSWIRTQPGSSSLRAILYMDEIFGYFPPTANPPSKKPMLTLLKQARAYGVGVVLTTQNPVDLDYKGLSNTGTWFLGRLQTERDKARVLDGLEGASATAGAGFDRGDMEATLAGLGSRVFLMHNVHDDQPVLFHTRWALSYLRGPLTRTQIKTLMASRKEAGDSASPPPARTRVASPEAGAETGISENRPVLPPEISESFVPWVRRADGEQDLVYRPALMGKASLHFVKAKHVDLWKDEVVFAPLSASTVSDPWAESEGVEPGSVQLDVEADAQARFGELPAEARSKKRYTRWKKQLVSHLYRERAVRIWKCRSLKQTSEPGETESEFRARLTHAAREKRDLALGKLEKRYKPKLARIQERIRRSQTRLEKEKGQYQQQKLQTAVSLGATVLGALFGRKAASVGTVGRATTTMRGAGRASRERGDVAHAQHEIEVQNEKLLALEAEFRDEVAQLEDLADPGLLELEEVSIRPRKSDMSSPSVSLVWLPWWVGRDGEAKAAFR